MDRQVQCKYILAITDFIFLILSFCIGLWISYLVQVDILFPEYEIIYNSLIHFCISVICIIWFWIRLRHYTYRKPFWYELREVLNTLVIFSIIELTIIVFSNITFSRYRWVCTWGITLMLVPLGRVLVKEFLIKIGWYLKNTVILGSGKNAIDAYLALSSEKYLGLKVVYFIGKPVENNVLFSIPVIDEDRKDLWKQKIHVNNQFIIALEDDEDIKRDNWLRYLARHHYRSVSVIPSLRGLPLYSTDMSFIFSYEVMLLRINNNLAKRSSRMLKRTVDIFLSLFLIILFSPLFLFICISIKAEDNGNVIYKHKRVGRNGKKFGCLKFRSMRINSDELLHEFLEKSPSAKQEWNRDFKLKNDPRVTKIGRFLRKTSLDELPQLFNVLIGQMSLVGPRPIVSQELKYYKEDVDYYLMAKPGMTGLWQVSGRNNVDYDTRVYFDAWYVKNWSLWNDFAILCRTPKAVLERNGAY
ncbi:undecaprenyl-phosphate galactose phosphotransferase WbaP [Aggregatibacter kilianii]|uniref:undecaprenyl-phosphate galactose phosphotransferase WbaP n=1 Tax=Aggregatibacter kilianii TaxID=2025884 RepID=UPI000D649435|nr:undecaprenyl-phosphate galactose phosphotransferase WbaP [Aggregatibacter kilianii]